MKTLWLVCCLFSANTLWAAAVEQVSAESNMVTLRLSKTESRNIKVGDFIKVTVTENRPAMVGMVKSIDGQKFNVQLRKNLAKPNQQKNVNVASRGIVPVMIKQKPAEGTKKTRLQNNIFHNTQVNPAQIYSYQKLRTDFSTSLSSKEQKLKKRSSGFSAGGSTQGPSFNAAAILHAPEFGINTGIKVHQSSLTGRVTTLGLDDNNEERAEISKTAITPILGKEVLPNLFVAFEYSVHHERYTGDYYLASHSFRYGEFKPGLTYHNRFFEAGLTLTPRTNLRSTAPSSEVREASGMLLQEADTSSGETLVVEHPPTTTIHGKVNLPNSRAAYASITHLQNRVFNTPSNENGLRNSWKLATGIEAKLASGSQVDAGVTYRNAAFNNAYVVSSDSIGELGVTANYLLNYRRNSHLGGGVSYARGSAEWKDQGDTNKLSNDTIQVKVLGIINI